MKPFVTFQWRPITTTTRRALGRAHLPPTKVFRRLSKWNHFKTTARSSGAPGFSRRKIPRSSAYTISEKAIRFRHPDYDPDLAQKLISSSMSRHLSIRNFSSKSMHAFLSNLANRHTDRQTNTGKTCTSSFVGGNNVSNVTHCIGQTSTTMTDSVPNMLLNAVSAPPIIEL